MKQIRTAALSRHHAPTYVMLGGLELMQLRKLQPLARWLFVELVAMADHVTGRIVTSYAVLEALLDFDQAPCAHAADKPTQRRVRTALEQLLELRMVRLDRIKNEKDKGLFLKVAGRKRISPSEGMSDRLSDRPEKAKKRDRTSTYEKPQGDERQTERQGVQQGITTPLSPLPVHSDPPAYGSIQAPPGGQERHAPPAPVDVAELLKATAARVKAHQAERAARGNGTSRPSG